MQELVGIPQGRIPFGKPRVKWRVIINWIFTQQDGGTDWCDRNRWGAVVSAVMNLLTP